MKIVIQCAGTKRKGAGRLRDNGLEVEFVAHSEKCTPPQQKYRRPDDEIGVGRGTWRAYLNRYNDEQKDSNPCHLCRAAELYQPRSDPKIYLDLTSKYGSENIFILSAGWGLVRSDYLLPYYNITFSGKGCHRRYLRDGFQDFNHLDPIIALQEEVYFFGGQSYLRLYYELTRSVAAQKVVYYCHPGKRLRREEEHDYCYRSYRGCTPRNWQYLCARDFMEGRLSD